MTSDWEYLAKREQRYYSRTIELEAENGRLKAALRDIAQFEPIPTGTEALKLAVHTAKVALGEITEPAIEF